MRYLYLFAAVWLSGFSAWADSTGVRILPGASRDITSAVSASRDTPLMSLHALPRLVRSAGVDAGLAAIRTPLGTVRVGIHGMLDQESTTDSEWGGFFIRGNNELWRGLYGFSLALSLEHPGRRWFGPGGALEIAVSARHESEHFTADNDAITEPRYRGVPHIGNALIVDGAARVPLRFGEAVIRLQHKLFIDGDAPNYTHGPGFDLHLRWRRRGVFHPFSSLFGEYLFGNTLSAATPGSEQHGGLGGMIPDAYFVRGLTGIVLNGAAADLWIYTSLEIGHGKGLLVFQEEVRWGAGVRLVLF